VTGPSILVVDDEEDVRNLLLRTLERAGFSCRGVPGTAEAVAWLAEHESELVLADIQMPGESGFELIRYVMRQHPETAIVMVSGFDDQAVAEQALELGAYGYVIKPFRSTELLITITNALRRRQLELEHRARQDVLEHVVLDRTADLRSSREETIWRLARLAEFRDDATGRHVQRVSHYCAVIAESLRLPPARSELLRIVSPLHDVGKVAIPDHILLKPGPLTTEERLTIEQHAVIGYEMLSGSGQDLLELAAVIALTHHEHFDGRGYPRGLAGSAIPLEGGIVAVADVFDALTSDRVYRPRLELGDALDIIKSGRATHFDPNVVDAFLSSWDEVLRVHDDYSDPAPSASPRG
jgi:putative two-component system response regulator